MGCLGVGVGLGVGIAVGVGAVVGVAVGLGVGSVVVSSWELELVTRLVLFQTENGQKLIINGS